MTIMKENGNSAWTWSDQLDALTASHQHHKLLFENGTVRVIDTLIPPKVTTAIHTHSLPGSLYILSWSDFIRSDDKNVVVVDSRTIAKSLSPATALWSEPLSPHKLENVSDSDLHIISVEIKKIEMCRSLGLKY